ncbi:uncharacterized protein LOC143469584 [Clavelina lepadiformis]|uniref:uncharacterized protein LOC143469584 n=1 Tax=Clavelina lepadiformis TaxID=159417 RepID=UPI004041DD3E
MEMELFRLLVLALMILVSVTVEVAATQRQRAKHEANFSCPKGWYNNAIRNSCCQCSKCPDYDPSVVQECLDALSGGFTTENEICIVRYKERASKCKSHRQIIAENVTTTTKIPTKTTAPKIILKTLDIPTDNNMPEIKTLAASVPYDPSKNDSKLLVPAMAIAAVLLIAVGALAYLYCTKNEVLRQKIIGKCFSPDKPAKEPRTSTKRSEGPAGISLTSCDRRTEEEIRCSASDENDPKVFEEENLRTSHSTKMDEVSEGTDIEEAPYLKNKGRIEHSRSDSPPRYSDNRDPPQQSSVHFGTVTNSNIYTGPVTIHQAPHTCNNPTNVPERSYSLQSSQNMPAGAGSFTSSDFVTSPDSSTRACDPPQPQRGVSERGVFLMRTDSEDSCQQNRQHQLGKGHGATNLPHPRPSPPTEHTSLCTELDSSSSAFGQSPQTNVKGYSGFDEHSDAQKLPSNIRTHSSRCPVENAQVRYSSQLSSDRCHTPIQETNYSSIQEDLYSSSHPSSEANVEIHRPPFDSIYHTTNRKDNSRNS